MKLFIEVSMSSVMHTNQIIQTSRSLSSLLSRSSSFGGFLLCLEDFNTFRLLLCSLSSPFKGFVWRFIKHFSTSLPFFGSVFGLEIRKKGISSWFFDGIGWALGDHRCYPLCSSCGPSCRRFQTALSQRPFQRPWPLPVSLPSSPFLYVFSAAL